VVLFVHMLGIVFWIGGALVALAVDNGVKSESPEVRAGVARQLARVHTMVIGLGALLATATGVLLALGLETSERAEAMREPRMWLMQLAGALGGLVVLFVALPTAVRMGGLAVTTEDGELLPAFEVYRKRLNVVTIIGWVFAVIALFAWEVL
jgi:predicted outer membrane lipoprotein